MRLHVGIVGIVLLAAPALAQYPPGNVPQPPEVTERRQPAEPFYDVTGRVADIDRQHGRVVLDAEGQRFALHFPPTALGAIRRGERVTSRLAIFKAIEGTSSEGAGSPATDPETGSPRARPPGVR